MKSLFSRMLNIFIGNVFYGLGIVVTIKANIGYAPWEVFHVGLAITTGLSIGLVSIIVGIVIVIIVTVSGEKFGIGTIISMILTGVFIDIFMLLNIMPKGNNLLAGIIMLIAGLFLISIGSYFYIKSAFGVGPRDNLMIVLTRKTKIPIGICRSATELLVTVVGWRLGGMVGIGTLISVVAIGFCIQLTFRVLKFDVTAVKHESLADTYRAFMRKRNEI